MPGQQSSNHKSSRLSTIQTLTTILAAVAGVAFTAYQTLYVKGDKTPVPTQVQVTVAVDPATGKLTQKNTEVIENNSVVAAVAPPTEATTPKPAVAPPAPATATITPSASTAPAVTPATITSAPLSSSNSMMTSQGTSVAAVNGGTDPLSTGKGDALVTSDSDLSKGALYEAALKDGSDLRYNYAQLFDSDTKTNLQVASPDKEINVMVTFPGTTAQHVSTIEYMPPDSTTMPAATVLDVMVLRDGEIEAGSPVQSFVLQTTPGKQTFTIPGNATGKAVWLRVAAPPQADKFVVGEFRILN